MTILRIEAVNGKAVSGWGDKTLEWVLNELSNSGHSVISHQAAYNPSEDQLIEVVLMHREES